MLSALCVRILSSQRRHGVALCVLLRTPSRYFYILDRGAILNLALNILCLHWFINIWYPLKHYQQYFMHNSHLFVTFLRLTYDRPCFVNFKNTHWTITSLNKYLATFICTKQIEHLYRTIIYIKSCDTFCETMLRILYVLSEHQYYRYPLFK